EVSHALVTGILADDADDCRALAPPAPRPLSGAGLVSVRHAPRNAVITSLLTRWAWHALQQQRHEGLYNGVDEADSCRHEVEVTVGFALLRRWVLAWGQGETLALAVAATAHGELVVALVSSVLYRSHAIAQSTR